MSHSANTPYSRTTIGQTHLKGAIDSLIAGHINQIGPSMLAQVITVSADEAAITGTVSVRPMIDQQDALARPLPHDIIHNVPYLRIQGGSSALIIDPQPGDIGFIVVSGRDQTHTIATRQPAPPASFRQFSLQDCVYIGGFLNNGPNQFIHATDTGWRIVTPGTVEIQASAVTANCDIITNGDVKAGSISLKSHVHPGVQSGSNSSAPPR